MARKTPRVKGRKKGKRWSKGQSSSSNPETTKFRDRAKKQNFVGDFDAPQAKRGASGEVEGLNIDMLSLNEGGTERRALERTRVPSLSAESDGKSSIGTSFGGRSRFSAATFASDWSQTSNVTFSRFLQNFQARSAQHREMLALLDAVTEIIKSRGGEENDTEYFCTLVAGLDAIEDETTLTAVIPFVVMCIKQLSADFLKAKFSELSKIFHRLLTEKAGSGSTSLLRGLVVSLGVLLRNQNLIVWEEANTIAMFNAILAFVIHPKPKIRKGAHAVVTSILIECAEKLAKPNAGAGPAGNAAAKFVRARLEEGIKDPKLSLTSTLHALELCRHVLRCFPSTLAKGVCELIVQLMSMNNTVVKKVCVDVMKDFFSQGEMEIPLSPKTMGQLLSALREVKPAATDPVLMPPWITAMKHGILTLHGLDEDLALKHLATFVPFLSSCWMTDSKPIMVAASCAMSGVIRRGVQPSLTKLVSELDMRGKDESFLGILEKSMLDGLKFQSHQAWPLVFQIWSLFFELCGLECLDLARQGIHQLGEMRTGFEEERAGGPEISSGTRKALGFALGKAIQVLGPRRFLEAYPLQITGREPFGQGLSRSWILPLLRDNIVPGCGAELEYFRTHLLPLSEVFHARSAGAIPNSPDSDKKVYGHLETQVWWLFPGFCASAIDLAATFPKMAKQLGTLLKTRPGLVKDVASGVKNCAELAAHNEGADQEAVSTYAKNFLPLFFVKYLESDSSIDIRARLMNAIKAYSAIAKPNVVWGLSEKALAELAGTSPTQEGKKGDQDDVERKGLVYDLCVALAPHLPDSEGGRENLEKLLNHALKICVDATAGHRVQKKAYRILEAICRGDTKLQRILVKSRRSDLVDTLVASLAKSSPVAKVARLKCVARLLEMETDQEETAEGVLSEGDEEFLASSVGEALLCVRDSKEATRNAAYGVIVKAAGFLKNRLQCDDEESIKRLLKYLLAGLGGNPQMIACSLLALGHICFMMKEAFPKDSLETIIDNTCLLLTTASREIVGAGLSLFKVLIKAYKPDVMTPHLKKMLKALENMTDDCKKFTRMESKKLYKKLVVKFGEKTVSGLSGAKDDPVLEKRLKNIRKEVAREKRARESKDSDDEGADGSFDEDDDAVDTDFGSTGAGKAKSKSRSRLTLAKTPSVATTRGIDRSKSIAEILAEVDKDDDMADDMEDEVGKAGSKKQPRPRQQGRAWIREKADEDIVDLLDPAASRSILAANPNSAARQQPKQKSKEEFAVSSDGRLIINDSDSDDSEDEKKNSRGKKRKLGASILAGLDANSHSTKSARNIRADDNDEEDWLRDFEDDKKSEASGTTLGIHRRAKKVKKTNAPEPYLGSEYKAKGGKGDVKRKGLPDPYAYFPLVRDAMNKRKAAKHKAKFKSVVGGARAGAAKGSKLKARSSIGRKNR